MSVTVNLPDGQAIQYEQGVAAAQVAEDISPRLAKAAVAAEVDGKLCDLGGELPAGTHQVRIVTDRDEPGLEVLRHTAAHVLAQAVVRLYGRDVQYTIGPPLMTTDGMLSRAAAMSIPGVTLSQLVRSTMASKA